MNEHHRKHSSSWPHRPVTASPSDAAVQLMQDLELHRLELELQARELHQTQQKLAASSERYRTLYEGSPVGYMTLDRKGVIQELNLVMAMLLGAEKDWLSGKPALLHAIPADRLRLHRFIQSCINNGSAPPIALTLRPGPRRPSRILELHGQAIPGLDATQQWCQIAVIDITARKQAEAQQRMAQADLEQRVAERTQELERAHQLAEARTRELRQAHHTLKALTLHLQQSQEAENGRIAREIHDELGAALTAIKYGLLTSRRREDTDNRHIHGRNPSLVKMIDDAIDSLRRIITDLRPSVLDELGLYGALEWLCREFQERTGIPCQFAMHGKELRLESQQATALFRIMQEALANVARHAQASQVTVQAMTGQRRGTIEVHDNGCGINDAGQAAKRGFGLLGMQERTHMINGAVEIASPPDGGTTIRVEFALPGADAKAG